MMFKRRVFSRPRRTFKRRFRPFAGRVRPKYDRVSLFNTLQGDFTQGDIINGAPDGLLSPCGPIVTPECSTDGTICGPCTTPPCVVTPVCCAKTTTIRVVNQGVLQNFFQDRVTIVSLYGDIWCRSLINLGTDSQLCSSDPISLGQYYARFAEHWSIGVRKMNQSQAESPPNPGQFTAPILDYGTPLYDYDWTEARWLMQRTRFWAPRPRRTDVRTVTGSQMGCCGDVNQAGYAVPAEATGNQPSYNVPALDTSCNPCQAFAEGSCPDLKREFQVDEPPWHHFRIKIRRHITLKADEVLDFQIGRRHPTMYPGGNPAGNTGWGCGGDTFPGESSTMIIHARLGAVLRLN